MAVGYEKMRGGLGTDEVVWVDEPQDILGDDAVSEQKRRHAIEVIGRMDSSKKWRRLPEHDSDAIMMVLGPDGATTEDGTPFADAVSAAMQDGASSASLVQNDDGSETVVAHHKDKPDVSYDLPKKKPTQADVRAWAREQGIDVNPMGQVPKALIEQYREAHGG